MCSSTPTIPARPTASTGCASCRPKKGDRARDIAFYEAGSTYDPSFDATSDTEVFLGWYTESGELLTDLTATENRTVYAQWESDFYD